MPWLFFACAATLTPGLCRGKMLGLCPFARVGVVWGVFLPLDNYCELPLGEMKRRAKARQFPIGPCRAKPSRICFALSGNAPSGANKQPWHFVAVANAKV